MEGEGAVWAEESVKPFENRFQKYVLKHSMWRHCVRVYVMWAAKELCVFHDTLQEYAYDELQDGAVMHKALNTTKINGNHTFFQVKNQSVSLRKKWMMKC